MKWLAELGGVALVLLALADVFLTVLYVRSGTAIISDRLARWVWRGLRYVAEPLPHRPAARLLSFGGGGILLLIISVWVLMLVVGFALQAWPNLGHSIQSSRGHTPTNFLAALYFAGGSLSTAGTSDLTPQGGPMRLVMTAAALIGVSTITLTMTYLLQVYSALLRRNTFALRLHFSTRGTGDAAELIAGLGATGDFSGARADLGALASDLVDLYEAHHFYSTLLYFRFRDPVYALSRVGTISMDTVTLIRTALDAGRYAALQDCAASNMLWEGGTHLLGEMARVLLPGQSGPRGEVPDEASARRWRAHYRAAAERFRRAGIATAADEDAGAEEYVKLRSQWDNPVRGFAAYMDQGPREADPASADEKVTT